MRFWGFLGFFFACVGVCSVEGSVVLNDNRQGRDGDYFE